MTATGLETRTTYIVNEHSPIWPNWLNDWAVFWVLTCTVHLTVFSCHVKYAFVMTDLAPDSSKEFLDIQAIIECGFTLKRVRDMERTYSQMHRADAYTEHSSIICSV